MEALPILSVAEAEEEGSEEREEAEEMAMERVSVINWYASVGFERECRVYLCIADTQRLEAERKGST